MHGQPFLIPLTKCSWYIMISNYRNMFSAGWYLFAEINISQIIFLLRFLWNITESLLDQHQAIWRTLCKTTVSPLFLYWRYYRFAVNNCYHLNTCWSISSMTHATIVALNLMIFSWMPNIYIYYSITNYFAYNIHMHNIVASRDKLIILLPCLWSIRPYQRRSMLVIVVAVRGLCD